MSAPTAFGIRRMELPRTEQRRRANRDQAKREQESQKPYKYFDLRHSFDIRHSDFVINKIRVYSCAFVVNR